MLIASQSHAQTSVEKYVSQLKRMAVHVRICSSCSPWCDSRYDNTFWLFSVFLFHVSPHLQLHAKMLD